MRAGFFHLLTGIGTVGPQDTATLTFPIGERIDKVWIEKKQYTLARRGNNVVSIYPHGRYYPFYQGGHFRSGKTQWCKQARFIPDLEVDW